MRLLEQGCALLRTWACSRCGRSDLPQSGQLSCEGRIPSGAVRGTPHTRAAEPASSAAQWKRLRGGAWVLLVVAVAAGVACTGATLAAVHEEAAVVQLAQQLAASSVQARLCCAVPQL